MTRCKLFGILGLLSIMFFAFFSWSVKRGALRSADFAFTVKLQEAVDSSPRLRLSRLAGEVMEGSTFLASPEVSITVIIFITIIIFIKFPKHRWRALAVPLLFTLLVFAELYGKSVVHHPAPPFFMIKNPTTVFPKYYVNEQFSYPSGHAARAVFLAVVLSYFILRTSYFKKKNVRIGSVLIFIGYIVLVSASRIYLGHHWLSDVFGGILLGGGTGFLALSLLSFRTDS